MQKIEEGDCSAVSFVASAEECIREGKCKLYDEGFKSEVKLTLYRTFSKEVGFKKSGPYAGGVRGGGGFGGGRFGRTPLFSREI